MCIRDSVYAIWKEKVFKVNFMDINGDKETIYHEEETKDGKITLAVYRNSEHENEEMCIRDR